MPKDLWKESHARDEYVSEAGIIGYRGRNSAGCKYYNHMPAIQIRNLVGNKVWNSYFKFTVIRNPFSKLVSGWYHFQKSKGAYKQMLLSLCKRPASIVFAMFPRGDIYSFREWIRNGGSIIDRDKYIINNNECVDWFIRHEFIDEDIAKVNSILGINQEGRELPKFKSGIRSRQFAIREFYDARTEGIVRRLYSWEFDRFGYEMP